MQMQRQIELMFTKNFAFLRSSFSACSIVLAGIIFCTAHSRLQAQTASPLIKISDKVLLAQQQRIAAIEHATQSTVGVFSDKGDGGGSGMIISSDGYVLTNFHVSSPFGHQMRCGLSDGRMFDAVVVGIDPTGDLALLKMFIDEPLPAATIADSDTVQQGDWCFAAGNPFVLATNLEPTVTWGIVSGTRRYQYPSASILEYTDCIQTDAAINPGNSGGPLYNAEGSLIGINGRCSFEKRGRVNVGVGYAISINQAMLFLKHLKSGRIVDHATLGFTVASDTNRRVLVSNILPTSDAFRRGLRYDDEILSLAGREIKTVNELKNVLGIFPAKYRVPLTYRRDGRTISTWIRLAALHNDAELLAIVEGESQSQKPPQRTPPKDDEQEPADQPAPEETELADKSKEKEQLSETFKRYIARPGFGNYYFNEFELRRIEQLDATKAAWANANQELKVTGVVEGEATPLTIALDGNTISTSIGDQKEKVLTKSGWSRLVDAKSFHAMGLALQLWRDWQQKPPQLIGAATYIGGGAVVNEPQQFDLTQITAVDVETLFYSDDQTGQLRLIELISEAREDHFEFYIDSYQVIGGRSFPAKVRFGYSIDDLIPATLEFSDSDSRPNPAKPVQNDAPETSL